MKSFVEGVRCFLLDEEGANGVEYALLAGLIAIVFVAGAGLLGQRINTFLTNVAGCVATHTVAACTGI